MKVAITAQGPELSSPVDPRFGRARFIIVVDIETGDYTAHDNSINASAAQGAGVQAGQNVANLGVDALVTGNVGPRAFSTLQAAGLAIYTGATGEVHTAIEQFRAGQLKCADGANVQGHWQ